MDETEFLSEGEKLRDQEDDPGSASSLPSLVLGKDPGREGRLELFRGDGGDLSGSGSGQVKSQEEIMEGIAGGKIVQEKSSMIWGKIFFLGGMGGPLQSFDRVLLDEVF